MKELRNKNLVLNIRELAAESVGKKVVYKLLYHIFFTHIRKTIKMIGIHFPNSSMVQKYSFENMFKVIDSSYENFYM